VSRASTEHALLGNSETARQPSAREKPLYRTAEYLGVVKTAARRRDRRLASSKESDSSPLLDYLIPNFPRLAKSRIAPAPTMA